MSDFLEVKAMKTEIASGLGMEGSTLVLVDAPMEEIDNEGDAQKLADWLWHTVPYRTVGLAIEELERMEKNEEEE